MAIFHLKFALRLKKICYKVKFICVRPSASGKVFIGQAIHAKMVGPLKCNFALRWSVFSSPWLECNMNLLTMSI